MTGMVSCRGCGKEIHSTALMCPMCGAPQAVAAQSVEAPVYAAPTAPPGYASTAAPPTYAAPPAAPPMYAAPAVPPRTWRDYASRTDLPESWKRKFALIEKAGGPRLPNFSSLTLGERMQVGFNVLALLFGPIYYLIKGLWQQALAYTGIWLVAIFILNSQGASDGLLNAAGFGFAGLCAARANIGYYKKEVFGEVIWF